MWSSDYADNADYGEKKDSSSPTGIGSREGEKPRPIIGNPLYCAYVDAKHIYKDPVTQDEFVWDEDVNQWLPKNVSASPVVVEQPKPADFYSRHQHRHNELFDEEETVQIELIELTFSKQELFFRAMGEWYNKLTQNRRQTLTKQILKSRVLHEAFRVQLAYSRIPLNWLDVVNRTYGLEVFRKVRMVPRINGKKKAVHEGETDFENVLGENGEEQTTTSCGRKVKIPKPFVVEIPKRLKKIPGDDDGDGDEESPVHKMTKMDETAKPRRKKIVDLSDEPPPEWWIQKYNSTRTVPPRELRLYNTDDNRIIMFYDYDLPDDFYSKAVHEATENGDTNQAEKFSLVKYAHSGNGFDWFTKKNHERIQQESKMKSMVKPVIWPSGLTF